MFDNILQRAAIAELNEAVEALLVLFATIVTHDIGMMQFGEIVHDDELAFIVGKLFEHLTFHEFDCDDFVLRDPVAFVDDTEVSSSQLFRLIHVEVISNFLH
jgi:hypothetical protein